VLKPGVDESGALQAGRTSETKATDAAPHPTMAAHDAFAPWSQPEGAVPPEDSVVACDVAEWQSDDEPRSCAGSGTIHTVMTPSKSPAMVRRRRPRFIDTNLTLPKQR